MHLMSSEPLATSPNPVPKDDFELPVEGFQGTPEEIERQWFEKVYRGRGDSMAQLTWRAILMGSVLGGVLSLTNLYIGLKSGWGFGVAITACILSYSVWTTMCKMGLAGSQMTILENNCMQSTASSAGYSTGGTLISAFAAYMMMNAEPMPILFMLAWVFFLAVLGVTMAIPMKRQMINIEQLRFPSGIAAAETLQALHSHGEKAMRSAKALGIAGIAAAISQFWADGPELLDKICRRIFGEAFTFSWQPASITNLVEKLNQGVMGKYWDAWNGRTVQFVWDPVFLAAGALTGLRVSTSMMVGGTLCWAVFVPILQNRGIIGPEESDFRALVQWTLWGGAGCMVASGLFSFAMQWRSMLRACRNLVGIIVPEKKVAMSEAESRLRAEMAAIETPTSWFVWGQLVSLVALAWLAYASFRMPWWQSAVAVPLAFFLSLVACRVTGETDTTPVGAMGQTTQLIFKAIGAGNVNVTLMSANITSAAAGSSADLLTDLKSGYLLGAHPRKQFLAQFAGIFAGTLVTVLCFNIMVPDVSALGGKQFPASAALVWKAVAVLLKDGIESLGPVRGWSMVIGTLVGILLPLLSMLLPKYEKWIPSAAGMGLAWTFQWYYSLLFFLGALLAYGFEKKSPERAKEFMFPVASGIIAGGSLMAVLLIFCNNGPQIIRIIRQYFAG
jgi:OPT family oligopeptide transporter